MTLIITAATKENMVQVSDRRLTLPDGKLFDSLAHKLIAVSCRDARFSIAYTGLAHTGALYAAKAVNRNYQRPVGHSQSPYETTDEWLVDFLGSLDTRRMDPTAIHDSLVKQAETTFSRSGFERKHRGLTFVLSGYWTGDQFIMIISNMEDAKGNRTPVSDAFQSWTGSKREDCRKKSALVLFHGATAAIHDTIGRRLGKIAHHIYDLPGPEVVNELELLIRATARHPTLGKYIGRECSHAIVAPRPGIILGDDQLATSGIATMPPFILGGGAFKGISFRPADDGK